MKLKHNTYWFKPKPIGYGAQPTTWEGYLVIVIYIFLILGITFYVLPYNEELFIVLLFLSIASLWKLSESKTEEKWKWRWYK